MEIECVSICDEITVMSHIIDMCICLLYYHYWGNVTVDSDFSKF